MKRLILLVLVCTLVIPMFSVASALTQVSGEAYQSGSVSNLLLAEDQAHASFSGIHACLEFCLYAVNDAYKSNAYIRNDVYYSFAQGDYLSRCGRAEFASDLSAVGGRFFPEKDTYHRVVSTETFNVNNTLYYRCTLWTNLPSAINGHYLGWISNTSTGD